MLCDLASLILSINKEYKKKKKKWYNWSGSLNGVGE